MNRLWNLSGKPGLRLLGVVLPVAAFLVGCGGDGLDRQVVTGTVTHNGQPVPRGSIWFEPEASVGNAAPTGFAVIRDGQFATEPDQSPSAGKHRLRITGFDGSVPDDDEWDSPTEYPGKQLFPEYVMDVVIPPPDGQLEIEIAAP